MSSNLQLYVSKNSTSDPFDDWWEEERESDECLEDDYSEDDYE